MPEFTPEAAAIVRTIAENASNAVRQAYVLGAQQRAQAVGPSDGSRTLEEWRREVLARYAAPSWKRTLAKLVPASRFRPTDIYKTRRSELKALHPENNSLNIGTLNALGAMRKDGVIAKLGDVYAPAIDGVPLSAVYDDAQAYRPRNAYGDDFARLLGFTVVSWFMLESALDDLIDTLSRSGANHPRDAAYCALVERFAATVERVANTIGPCTLRHLEALAIELHRLAGLRTSLAGARPCLVAGRSVLRCNDGLKAARDISMTWESSTLIDTCRAFDDASAKCVELSYRLRLTRQPGFAKRTHVLDLARLRRVPLAKAAAIASDAIVQALLPLIVLVRVVASSPRDYANALEHFGILEKNDVDAILSLLHGIDRLALDGDVAILRDARSLIEDLWGLARSPASVRRAIAHRARRAGKVPSETDGQLAFERSAPTPLLSVDGAKIVIAAKTPNSWKGDEIIVDLKGKKTVYGQAIVSVVGMRVYGNEAAIRLAPWLVDEPSLPGWVSRDR